MIRRLVRWLVAIPRRDRDDENGDDENAGFAGSLLDASVNFAHGDAGGHDAIREMERLNEEASKLQHEDDRSP